MMAETDPLRVRDVEVMEAEIVMDASYTPYTPCGPWGSLYDSTNIMRMCLQEDDGGATCTTAGSSYAEFGFDPAAAATPYPYQQHDSGPADYFSAAEAVETTTIFPDFFSSAGAGADAAPTYGVDGLDGQAEHATAATLRPTECPTCRRDYISEKALSRHLRYMHSGPRVWHVCDVCGKPLATARSLRSHRWLHSARRPFECPVCAAGFLQRTTLRTHMVRLHSTLSNLAVKLEDLGAPRRTVAETVVDVHDEDLQDDRHPDDGHLADGLQQGDLHPSDLQQGDLHPSDLQQGDRQLTDLHQNGRQDAHQVDHQEVLYNDQNHLGYSQDVGVDSGSIVIVKSDLEADDASSDSGVSSPPPSWERSSSAGAPSPALSATSEDSATDHIVVRLVRDMESGSWKIDLGE